MRLRPTATTAVFSMILSTIAHAATIDVPADHPTIQQAIDAAINGDEVVIAQGTYLEHIDLLGKAITLRSTDPNNPVVVAATIIDGGNDPDAPGFPQNVGTVVSCKNNEGPDTLLLGLTVTGGAAPGVLDGGGLGAFEANSTVTNCRFVDNHAANPSAFGAGAFCGFGGSVVFTGCEFIGNSGGRGPGLYIADSPVSVIDCLFRDNTGTSFGGAFATVANPSITLRDCTFENNTTTDNGGGAYLSGFINGAVIEVTNCDFINNSSTEDAGGAMYITRGDATVTGCLIRDNTADFAGGGVSTTFNTSMTITQCTFENNNVNRDGGGLSIFSADSTISDCQFSGNTALGNGGGLSLGGSSNTHRVSDCTFDGNEAVDGGAATCTLSTFEFDNCTVMNNHATDDGGGLRFSNATSVTLTNNVFELNSADDSGGGVAMSADAISVRNCDFTGNTAGSGGGGFRNGTVEALSEVVGCTFTNNTTAGSGGGASEFANTAPVQYINCVFQGNTAAEFGGGINDSFSDANVYANCLFVRNDAANGAGMSFQCAMGTVTSCTFTENVVTAIGGVLFLTCSGPPVELVTTRNNILWANAGLPGTIGPNTTLDVAHSDVVGGQGAFALTGGSLIWGPGNIDADPFFADPDGPDDDPNTLADNDYRLGVGSPCVDAADSLAVPAGISTDLDGSSRIVDALDFADTGIPDGMGQVVDMGAYEASPDLCFSNADADGDGICDGQDPCPNRKTGDVNGDGAANAGDVISFTTVILDPGAAAADDFCAADVNQDGEVDGLDVQGFADLLLGP